MLESIKSRYRRLLDWWLPFWYGPPCEHGTFGTQYKVGVVIECRECMRKIADQCRAEELAEQWGALSTNPAFQALRRRVDALETSARPERSEDVRGSNQ